MTRRLVMFTDCYPYSNADEWKRFELEVFAERFDEIHVASRLALTDAPDPLVPAKVNILPPVFAKGGQSRASDLAALALLARQPGLFDSGLSRGRLGYLRSSLRDVGAVLASDTWRRHVAPLLSGSHLYFFWGRGYADILPFLTRDQQAASLVRMHRYDLYPETNGGYMPFHASIVRAAGKLAPISEDGVSDLSRRFPDQAQKIECLRLGTNPATMGPRRKDGVLKLVSCAHAKPVKRLHLIAEALAHATVPVHWTHIGDGPELARLRDMAKTLPDRVTVDLPGAMLPRDVPVKYQTEPYDLFLNVSESEGVPVSIMEAMAAGIPALATDVGGTRELVTRDTGILVAAETQPAELWQRLAGFAAQDDALTEAMRTASAALVAARYDIRANARRVADAILQLPVAA